jgi:hypothetical protein
LRWWWGGIAREGKIAGGVDVAIFRQGATVVSESFAYSPEENPQPKLSCLAWNACFDRIG